jgi:hypothetical protein
MRKLFAAVDMDGSGEIDQDELEKLMTEVIGSVPNPESVARMMAVMDKDGDRSIQEKEFLDRMEEMLDEFEKTSGKRSRSDFDSPSGKATLHKQMKLVMGHTEHKDLEGGVAKGLDQYHSYAKTQFVERIGVFMERLGAAAAAAAAAAAGGGAAGGGGGGGGAGGMSGGVSGAGGGRSAGAEALWLASILPKTAAEQQQSLAVVSGLYLAPGRENLWKEILKELINPASPESLLVTSFETRTESSKGGLVSTLVYVGWWYTVSVV